jgi:hypothetical protein
MLHINHYSQNVGNDVSVPVWFCLYQPGRFTIYYGWDEQKQLETRLGALVLAVALGLIQKCEIWDMTLNRKARIIWGVCSSHHGFNRLYG